MKTTNSQLEHRKGGMLILIATLAFAASTIACSSNPKSASIQTVHASSRPATAAAVVPVSQPVAPATNADAVAKPLSKQITFKSRNYGVSFAYPRQYAYLSAKVIAEGDASLMPKPDGNEGQFTLARIEIPKGFFPDTDLDNGYFAMSLNQDIDEKACESSLGAAQDSKVQTETINGVDFKWLESETGGHGSAVRMRNYVAFTNGTCYELELGVKTSNANGLAREVDPDQVMRRLDSILKTVKIQAATKKGSEQLVSSNDTAQQ